MKEKEQQPYRMRRKIDREDGFQEGEVVEAWSKKRIAIAIAVTTIIIAGLIYRILSWTEGVISKPI